MTGTRRMPSPCRVVVLISGRGSNLKAIIDAVNAGELPVELRAVISNRRQASGLAHARAAGIVAEIIDHRDYPDRASFDRRLRERIDAYQPHLVALAGFMRVLTPEFIDHYAGRLMNIHPSLLPAFPGLATHERALAAGAKEHGATVHFVTAEVDSGPVIAQAAIPIVPGDTPESLAQQVLTQEHRLYPRAIKWFAEGRLTMRGKEVLLDGQRHPDQGLPLMPPHKTPNGLAG